VPALVTLVVIALALGLGRVLTDLRLTTAASPTPSAPAAQTGSAAATASAKPAAIGVPAGPFVVGTARGGVYSLQPSGVGDRIFDCGGRAVSVLERSPDGQQLFVLCSDSKGSGQGYVWQVGSSPQALPLTLIPNTAAWSPDSRSLALLVPGPCTPSAPTCPSHIVRYEIASGAATTLRDDDVLIENLRWTARGLTYFRPSAPGQGSFVLEGNTWRRIAGDRVVTSASDGRLLLDRELFDATRSRHQVVLLTGTSETVLTAAAISERPLAFDAAGRVIALREEPSGSTAIVAYEGGRAVSVTPGDFGPIATRWNSWLLALTPMNAVAFYSIDATQFASPVRLGEPGTALALRPQ
jgi:hypothetical protein